MWISEDERPRIKDPNTTTTHLNFLIKRQEKCASLYLVHYLVYYCAYSFMY